MKHLADLLFEARNLKNIPRSGFGFLGVGTESVAEHSFSTAFIGFVLARLDPDVDSCRLVNMCLLHDLTESRTGDLNYVQKMYLRADEDAALADTLAHVPFGDCMADLIEEFNRAQTRESQLAHDADQLGLILELKALSDMGHRPPDTWIPHVKNRLRTRIGKQLAEAILDREQDAWWRKGYDETRHEKPPFDSSNPEKSG